jgi:uncharacterized phiE125 gp8 family phage protein
MHAEWTRTSDPASEPITLVEAKAQARITHTTEDSLLSAYVQTAREAAEAFMARGLLTQTWTLVLEEWADRIWLPMAAPLQSVSSVEYYATDGVLTTLSTSTYTVDTVSRPGRIVRAPAQTWPALQPDRLDGAVVITYVVGWDTASAIPERIKQGVRMYVTYLDCDRDGLVEYGAQARRAAEACWDDRVRWIPPECWP